MIPLIRDTIRKRWTELRLPGAMPTDVSVHLDSSDPREHGFVTFRAFRPGNPDPICLGRIPRDGVGARDALQEHDLLTALQLEGPHGTGRLFPRPLFVVERGVRLATGRSPLPGRNGQDYVDALGANERLPAALELGTRWLSAFGRATGFLEGSEGALWEPLLRSIHFESTRATDAQRRNLQQLTAAIDARRDGVVLCGFGHGSLTPAAFRVHGDRLGVVDWQHGRARQAPWTDPVHFALAVALRETGSPAAAARAALDPDHPVGIFLQERLEDVGVPAGPLPLAIPAVALSVAHRLERDEAADPDAWRTLAHTALTPADAPLVP